MSFKMKLGSYTFHWNPDEVTLPESRKTVATQDTYNGSAIFQWAALLEGKEVELEWKWMPNGMYESLRIRYLSVDRWRWVAELHKAFNVYVTFLEGKYVETGLYEMPYRLDVKMRLSLRSETSASTTTTAP